MGRPKTPIGAYGSINVRRRGRSMVAEARVRDQDGRVRQIRVAGPTSAAARHRLKERLVHRPEQNGGSSLRGSNSFAQLATLWLADLEMRDLAEGTRQNYRDTLRLHVLPAFEHYALVEITTGRVEWFLKAEAKASVSRAKQSRTVLNLVFAFALRARLLSTSCLRGWGEGVGPFLAG